MKIDLVRLAPEIAPERCQELKDPASAKVEEEVTPRKASPCGYRSHGAHHD